MSFVVKKLPLAEQDALDAAIWYEERQTGLGEEFLDELDRAARALADSALHHRIRFSDVRRTPVPMLSIVQATCDHARGRGLKRLGLLGTGFTMRARFFPDVFARAGLELVTPGEAEQAFVHQKYIHELLKNQFLPETRAALIGLIDRMRNDDRIEALILAGTELPLLLRGAKPEGLPFLDTTMIHVRAAVDAIVG